MASIKDLFKTRSARRQAERESKATGASPEVIAHREMLEKNGEEANRLMDELLAKLMVLGFRIEGFITWDEFGAIPRLRLMHISYQEYKEVMEKKAVTDKEVAEVEARIEEKKAEEPEVIDPN